MFSFVFLAIISSCSQQQNKTDSEVIYVKQDNNIQLEISPLANKTTNSIHGLGTISNESFIHHAKISRNVGSFVNNNLTEIVPITTSVPACKESFNFTYFTKDRIINNPVTLVNIVFDNDIFDNTDYYYTNGINIELVTPVAANSPLSSILVGLRNSQIDLHGFSLRQNIYTPVNPDIEDVSVGDRPFSAFLTIGQFRQTYNFDKYIFIKSSFNIGVIGPASLGGFVQSSIHDIEPVGWSNQINNNIIIDYQVKLEKGIISTPHVELNITAGGNVGTIFNKINGGLYFRAGSFIPVYRGLSTIFGASQKNNKLQYWFFMSGHSDVVFFDATLQGSMFNTKSPYVIQSNDINRFVLNLSVGFAMYYKKVGFELQNFYLSPEFTNAYDFRWGRIKLTFQI
jgi:hypothetical protein